MSWLWSPRSDYTCADGKLGEPETPEKWSTAGGRRAMDGGDWGRVQTDSREEREGPSVLAWPPLSKAMRSELFCWKRHKKRLEKSAV